MPTINSKIGEGVKAWHEDLINIYGSEIGDNTKIGSFVEIGKCKVGNNCIISSFCFLCEGVIVEDDVFLGPRVTMTNILYPRAFINQKDKFVPTMIRRGASIGAGAVIIAGVEVGRCALIGAGAVVSKDVMPYSITVGNPAKHWGWVCRNGCNMRSREVVCPTCGVTND